MTVLVYRYGTLPPHINAAFVDDQMWLAHRYRNDLTAIERARRDVIRQIERRAGDIPALELALAEAEKHEETTAGILKAVRSTTRKRSETAEQTQALRDAREDRKRISMLLSEARRTVRKDPEIQAEKKLVDGGHEYDAWMSMIDRCYDPEHELYKSYGAKGIRVCQAWRESLPAFLRDVGERPTIDQPKDKSAPRETRSYVFTRDNVRGNYEPGNAGWRLSHDVEDDARRGQRGGRIGELKRGAREIAKVGWGIYARVEAQADAARKAIDKTGLYDGLLPNDPRFSRWRGDGFVGAAQLTDGGISLTEIYSGEDTRVKIGPGVRVKQVWDPKAHVHRSVIDDMAERKGTGERNKTLYIRLGKGASAAWCAWPMIMHRPIPDGATIKEVVVHRKMRGPREEWYATIVVDTANDERVRGTSGAVAIDLGWRLMEDGGIRIGAWQATDGKTGEVRLTPTILAALTKAASIRSIRDKNFDAAREELAEWFKTAPPIPAWLAEQVHYMAKWKSPDRMRTLVYRWKANRFDGDEQGYTLAEAWRYREHHLWCYEEGARTRALRRRKQLYRVEAKRLAAMYHTVVLEDFDLSDMAKRPEFGSAKDVGSEEDAPRAQRQLVAPSDLRLCLIHAFSDAIGGAVSRGQGIWQQAIEPHGLFIQGNHRTPAVVKVPTPNTTRMCNACGVVHAFDAKKNVWRVPDCPECGATWDQDYNAARNMLDLWRDGKIIEPKAPRGGDSGGRSRFERAKIAGKQTKEKELRKRAAAE